MRPVTDPFAEAAADYLAEGWHPFPAYHAKVSAKTSEPKRRTKAPRLKGVIGGEAIEVTPELVARWVREYPRSQLGLRLPRNVLGIDVDAYDGKSGGIRIRELVAAYGPLPPTWISTSRLDGSGIRMYHVENSAAFPYDLRKGVEVIRCNGRFVMAAPSTHPNTGDRYGWIPPGARELVFDEFPSALGGDLAALPASWVSGLAIEIRQRPRVRDGGPDAAAGWVSGLPGGEGEPCADMRRTLDRYLAEFRAAVETGGGRHDAALRGSHAILGDAVQGHRGAYWALVRMGRALIAARGGNDGGEFRRMVEGAVAERRAEPRSTEDPCDSELARLLP